MWFDFSLQKPLWITVLNGLSYIAVILRQVLEQGPADVYNKLINPTKVQ